MTNERKPAADSGQPPWNRETLAWQEIDGELPLDHFAREVNQLVERLELSGLLASYAGRGREAYPPQLMLKMALFAHQEGRNRPVDWYRDERYTPGQAILGTRNGRQVLRHEFLRRLRILTVSSVKFFARRDDSRGVGLRDPDLNGVVGQNQPQRQGGKCSPEQSDSPAGTLDGILQDTDHEPDWAEQQ